jgi:hypothetical protein
MCKYGTTNPCRSGVVEAGTEDSINYTNNTGRYGFCYRVILGWGNSIVNCDIYKTRQIVFATGGALNTMKNCRLFFVNGERSSRYTYDTRYGFTPSGDYTGIIRTINDVDTTYGADIYSIYPTLVVDIEDESRQVYYSFWDNVEVVTGKVDAVKIDGGTDYHFKNCKNFYVVFGSYTMGCFVENCSIGLETIYYWGLPGTAVTIKNSIISSLGNGTSNNQRRGAYSGDLYIRNSSVGRLIPNGGLNDLIHNNKKLKM